MHIQSLYRKYKWCSLQLKREYKEVKEYTIKWHAAASLLLPSPVPASCQCSGAAGVGRELANVIMFMLPDCACAGAGNRVEVRMTTQPRSMCPSSGFTWITCTPHWQDTKQWTSAILMRKEKQSRQPATHSFTHQLWPFAVTNRNHDTHQHIMHAFYTFWQPLQLRK